MSIVIEKFDPGRSYQGQKKFDCGHTAINGFVRSSLKNQVKKSLSVAYVLLDTANNGRLVGFHTIAQHMIPLDKLQALELGSLPRQVPCTRLIMLGVDADYQGKQLGSKLMKHALKAAKTISASVGSAGMYLDADAKAVKFYAALGFRLPEGDKSPDPSPMFIALESIA